MTTIALRVYTEPKDKKTKFEKNIEYPTYDMRFVFDTECTADEYQNLKFGSFAIYFKDTLQQLGLFYNPDRKIVSKDELNELQKFCKKDGVIKLYTLKDFIEKIFYQAVYREKYLCVGFNLPFDISRLALGPAGDARKIMKKGFVLKLSKRTEDGFPPIDIKRNNATQSFIRFQSTQADKFRKTIFQGFFVDLKTLGATLTDDKHISLASACKMFNTSHQKLTIEEYGKINQNAIQYNLNDTLASGELFSKLKEEFDKYDIRLPLNQVFSQASLAKGLLKQLGIKPFLELNPQFRRKMLSRIMQGYYGGKVEVRKRKIPTEVTIIDFNSMYPTCSILCGLDRFLTAKRIVYKKDTENARKLLEKLKIDDLRNPAIFKDMNYLCEVKPNEDVLPIRAKYDEKTYNVGVNFVTSKRILPYAFQDLVVSKLLTGKCPEIVRAYKFIPIGQQFTLRKTNVLGLTINPRDNLLKGLIEEKERMKESGDSRYKAVKILATTLAYGIYIEIDKSDRKDVVCVYAKKKFFKEHKVEKQGVYFNPLLALFITSTARLFLGIIEYLLSLHSEVQAYCDTDSMFIPPEREKEIETFFKPLNPYKNISSLFKVEERNIMFYGISSKRYVLYRIIDKNIIINEKGKKNYYSLHGLNFLNPFGDNVKNWQKQVWLDILKMHYKQISPEDFQEKYQDYYAISQFTVSTSEFLRRFEKFNNHRRYSRQIKPFNFFLIGLGNNPDADIDKQNVKPITPYSRNPQSIVYGKFIDYKTGKVMQPDTEYWRPLDEVLWDYVDHPESKLEGNEGILKRRHIIVHNVNPMCRKVN